MKTFELDFVQLQIAIANIAASMYLLIVSKGTGRFVREKIIKVKTSAFNEGFQTLKLQTCSMGFTSSVKGIQSFEKRERNRKSILHSLLIPESGCV